MATKILPKSPPTKKLLITPEELADDAIHGKDARSRGKRIVII